ncbi:hypothetical protein [Clostridium sp.]|uniref:hypothetical protein n=1 Tax=Clostridium sp. TaxID=1506 RepID=UPI002638CF62|nr:hypothetical protein [uncultured Clostridium sp.]
MFVDNDKDNKIHDLEYELKEMKLQYELMKCNSNKELKEYQNRNKILSSKLLTRDEKIIILESNRDTTELYIKYLEKEASSNERVS